MSVESYHGDSDDIKNQQGQFTFSRDLAKTTPNLGSHVLLVDDLADSGKTLIKSIKWLEHFYGFYFEEKIKTAVIWHKSTSKFKPDYSVNYLKDSPWIHMPFEKYETTNIKDFNFDGVIASNTSHGTFRTPLGNGVADKPSLLGRAPAPPL